LKVYALTTKHCFICNE